MTSTEAFGAQLASKIDVDLTGLRKQIEKGQRALDDTRAELAALDEETANASQTSADTVSKLEEERSSVKAVQQLFGTIAAEAASLARDVTASADLEAKQRQNTESVRMRIEQELSEAQARQRAAEARKGDLDRQMKTLTEGIETAERSAEAELSQLSDVALAARLKAELAQRTVDVYQAEVERLQDQEPAVRLHEAKASRAKETRAQVAQLAAQLAADGEALEALAKKERAIEQSAESAQSRAAAAARLYESQIGAVRKLGAQHEAHEAKLLGASKREGVSVAETQLLGEAADFVRAQAAAAQKELQSLEQGLAEERSRAEAASSARQLELRSLRAEAKALRVAYAHREQFHSESKARMVAEEREAADAALEASIGGRATCTEMVRAEHEAAQQAYAALAQQASAAERARDEKSNEVEALKASNRAERAALDSSLCSEGSVLVEQQRYLASLEARLREDSLQCVDGATADSRGARARVAIDANATEARQFEAELRTRSEKCEAALAEEKRHRTKEAKRGEAEARRLAEARDATAEALQKLEQYEESLANEQRQAAPHAPLPSFRAPDVNVALEASTAPGAPPALAEDVIEASRLIDRISASTQRYSTGSQKQDGPRSASPIEVTKLQM